MTHICQIEECFHTLTITRTLFIGLEDHEVAEYKAALDLQDYSTVVILHEDLDQERPEHLYKMDRFFRCQAPFLLMTFSVWNRLYTKIPVFLDLYVAAHNLLIFTPTLEYQMIRMIREWVSSAHSRGLQGNSYTNIHHCLFLEETCDDNIDGEVLPEGP